MQQDIILQTKPSIIPIIATWPIAGIIIACFFFIAGKATNLPGIFSLMFIIPGLFFLLAGFLRCIFELMQRECELYTLTDKEIIIEHGVFNHDTETLTLDQIKGTRIERPLAGQILDYGHIIIFTWTGGGKLYYIPHPQQWINAMKPRID